MTQVYDEARGSRRQQVDSEGKRHAMMVQALWEEEEGWDQQPTHSLA